MLILYTPDSADIAHACAKHIAGAHMHLLEEAVPKGVFPTIVPLLSPELLTQWENTEIGEWAMDQLADPDIRLVPVIAHDCMWEESLFMGLQVLPFSKVPLTNSGVWTLEDAMTHIQSDLQSLNLPPTPPQKGGFKRAAAGLMWRLLPRSVQWAIRIGTIAIAGLLGWGLITLLFAS